MPHNQSNPHNQLRGAQNRAQGDIFEQIIDASCLYYRECGVAEIEKTPEPFRVTRRLTDYQFSGHFEKKAQPDYKGTLQGGKAIAIEAKHTEGDRIKQDRVTPEQTAALDRHYRLGAACFVLVSIKMNTFALVPWTTWAQMKQTFGHKYMTENELQPYRVPFKGRIVFFLDEVRKEFYHV